MYEATCQAVTDEADCMTTIKALSTGVCLRASGIKTSSHARSLTSPSIRVPRSRPPSPAGRSLLIQYGWAESHVDSCCEAGGSYRSWVLLTKDAGHPLALISTQLSDLQGLPPLPGGFLQPGSSPAPFQAPAFPT